MANISSAFGSVMIQAQTPELIKKLLQLHEASERTAYYDTTIDFDEKEFDTKIYKVPNEDKYAYESYFSANGRWTFESNVNWFFSPLKGNYDEEFEKDDVKLIQLKNEIKEHDFEVIFKFTDSESGCDFIHKGEAILDWNAEEQDDDVQYNIIESYDYTVESLLDCEIYDEGEVLSVQYILDHYNEVMRNEDEIFMKYRNKVIELLEELPYKDTVLYEFDELYDQYTEFNDLVDELKCL